MKKEYEAPKAERMEFNYSEAVVASGNQCQDVTPMTNIHVDGQSCTSDPAGPTVVGSLGE